MENILAQFKMSYKIQFGYSRLFINGKEATLDPGG